MNIVFVTVELATAENSSGGLASFTANIARIFAQNGHQVTILLVTSKEMQLVFDDSINVKSIYIKKKIWDFFDKTAKCLSFGKANNYVEIRKVMVSVYKSIQTRRQIKVISKKKKIDIVHYCNLSALALFASQKIPYVIRISGWAHACREADLPNTAIQYRDAKLFIGDRLLAYPVKKSRYVISPSTLSANIGKEKFGITAKVIESPYILNEENWDDSLYQSLIRDKKYIIHYGSLKYLKGTHVVAQLANELLREYSEIYLVLAGNSEELLDKNGKKIKADEFVKKSAGEFADRVIYAGRLVREQLYPFIQNAELCLLPYRMDNLSNACIEAMAMGKIVIGTDGASFEQLIEDRVSGFLCERDNPESYMEAVREAMAMSAEEKEKMGQKALEVTKRLEPQKIYQQYLEFYKKVIDEWK